MVIYGLALDRVFNIELLVAAHSCLSNDRCADCGDRKDQEEVEEGEEEAAKIRCRKVEDYEAEEIQSHVFETKS